MLTLVVAAATAVVAVIVTWTVARRRPVPPSPAATEPPPRPPAPASGPESMVPPIVAAPVVPPPVAITASRGPLWNDVIDRLSLGVVVAGTSGRIHYRNRAADALAGTHMGLLVDDAVERLLAQALEGEPSRQDLELYGPPRLAVVVTASPLDGGAAVATIEDVSERRRVDAVRTDFVANVSHELKTPVGALAVLAEALADEDDLDVVHRVAGRMADEAMRVTRTIDDLLELSRIELGEEPRRDRVDIVEIVEDALVRTRQLAEDRRIEVAALELPTSVRVDVDRRQLVSALGNLVENAVKYSEPGSSVQVRVRIEGDWVELMVADHGIGIPAGDHRRIFERFYRVDKARGRDTGGTGLGLAIVRHVATNHRGEVLVSSQEGEGSTFVLRIPVASVASDSTQEAVTQ